MEIELKETIQNTVGKHQLPSGRGTESRHAESRLRLAEQKNYRYYFFDYLYFKGEQWSKKALRCSGAYIIILPFVLFFFELWLFGSLGWIDFRLWK